MYDLLNIAASVCLLMAFPLFVVLCVWRVVGMSKSGTGRRTLAYLESAVRLNAPLPQMMESAAASESGRFGTRLWNCSQELFKGATVFDALRTVTDVSERNRQYVGAAERSGRLGEGLTLLMDREEKAQQLMSRTVEWVYPLAIMGIITGMVALFGGVFWPRFQEIFNDFNIERPALTRFVFEGAGIPWLLLAMLVLAVVFAIILFTMTAATFARLYGGRLPGQSTAREWMDIAARVPLIGGMIGHREWADVCGVLSMNLRSSVPLVAALNEASTLHLNPLTRYRLNGWARALERGDPTAAAARKAGLPRLIVGMFASGQASADAGSTFEFLQRYYDSRYSRTLELLRGAVVPASVLIVGALAGAVIVSMMLPAFQIIDSMTKGQYP